MALLLGMSFFALMTLVVAAPFVMLIAGGARKAEFKPPQSRLGSSSALLPPAPRRREPRIRVR